MRMWMIDPSLMCKRHICGEHNEIHKHLPSLLRGISINGRFNPIVQIELCSIIKRHNELAALINHKSPLQDPDTILETLKTNYPEYFYLKTDIAFNLVDLKTRCVKCRELILQYEKGE